MTLVTKQFVKESSDPATEHPSYTLLKADWQKVRDCIQGESVIKSKKEKYLPRPSGMSGEYADAYDAYIERAHFPQICSYALSGALGVIITKLPEFNVPKEIEYIKEEATKDGISLQQLFLDIIIEILTSGRCPVVVDIVPETNQFKFVRYNAEDFINWKTEVIDSQKNLILGVLKEAVPATDDIFSHDSKTIYRVMTIEDEHYISRVFTDEGEETDQLTKPSFMGNPLGEIPLFIGGSINNNVDIQPVPLLSISNCSIQIYRKEADLANSEYLSCNPTLCMVGASNDDELPNVVGSSVMIVLPDPQARIFYTVTDTAALDHVKNHIKDLYEEGIRHGVSILDTRKGVESAEALRIRQATQSASIYSIYLSALNTIRSGLQMMCLWAKIDKNKVVIDAPTTLTFGIPDSNVIREVIEGFAKNVIPLEVIHRYLIASGLLDQKTSFEEYMKLLKEQKDLIMENNENKGGVVTDKENKEDPDKKKPPVEDKSTDNKENSEDE